VAGSMKINKPGTLLATALCNIHGLWENSKAVKVK
jgi:superoxide reductase